MTNGEKYKTAKERADAFSRFCEKQYDEPCMNKNCIFRRKHWCDDCPFHWLELEAEEEEKPLPCPFCGGETVVRTNWNDTHQVVCNSQGCWYSSKCETSKSDAISGHNRVARKCMETNNGL